MLKKTFLLFSLLILLLVLFWGFSQVREQQASPELAENESLTESSSHSPEEADSLATTTTDSALRVAQALGSDTAAKILNRKRRLEAARGSAGENYAHFDDNPVKHVSEHPVSTFSIDVDTGAYANVRRMLNYGHLPPHDAVRVEEMINYFAYDYPLPDSLDPPFKVTTEIAPTAWNQKTHLLHIGIKGYNIPKDKLPPANLVFLVDVSGSMQSPDKLELLKSTLKLLTQQLTAKDKVSLVVYAGATGLVLEPTQGNQSGKILAALERLSAGGSTNGGAGIQLAYAVAEQAFIKNGINRVLLATDGDFNVGTVNFEALKNIIEEKRKTGISLTTLGFGTGNYNDHLMEQLADAGNGNYAYIDNLNEAQKVLVNEMSSTLNIIAKDVKMNVTPLRYFVSD
jgi:Ca-activated chloride channel family protein